MKINSTHLGLRQRRSTSRRGGFTMVEILVAVSIMSLLLAIILIPLRLGFESYHIGTARTNLQQEAQLTMQQIGKDFQRANFIFPNSRIRGVSDNTTDSTSPCSLRPYNPDATGWNFLPYFKSTLATVNGDPAATISTIGITNSEVEAFSNPNRIDMLLQRNTTITKNPDGTIKNIFPADIGEDYVISYYSRRLNISIPHNVIDNPIVLFRAQYPYRYYRPAGASAGATAANAGFVKFPATPGSLTPVNAEIDWSNYGTLGAPAVSPATDSTKNRDFLWITHNFFGEANLEPLTLDVNPNTEAAKVPRSHTLAIPRGMQLIAPNAISGGSGAYMPELSFVQTTSDGKRIDRVTVSMTLAQYDQVGAASVNGEGRAQRVPVTQTFDLPNAGCPN